MQTTATKDVTAEVNAMIQELEQIVKDLRKANADLTGMAEQLQQLECKEPSSWARYAIFSGSEIPMLLGAFGEYKASLKRHIEHLTDKRREELKTDPDSTQARWILDEIEECEHEIAEFEQLSQRLYSPHLIAQNDQA